MEDSGRPSVLIVDDNNANILALTHILTEEFTIYAAKDGINGIRLAKKHLPDLILLDILMPEMDGYEVLYHLRHTVETRNIPVIFVTGYDSAENERRGLSQGAVAYIRKPFDYENVKDKVREFTYRSA